MRITVHLMARYREEGLERRKGGDEVDLDDWEEESRGRY
jgi:hypothetical protein